MNAPKNWLSFEGSVAEWLGHRTRNLAIPRSTRALLDMFQVVPDSIPRLRLFIAKRQLP